MAGEPNKPRHRFSMTTTPSQAAKQRDVATLYNVSGPVQCPRCHEQCGWCSDYRWMHGKIPLPGSRRKCTVPGYEPEAENCPVCHGERSVIRTVTYAALAKHGGKVVFGDEA